MLQAFVITSREGIEAFLIVALSLAYLRKAGRAELIKAIETAKIESPRGPFALTKSHNPIHDVYLRKVEGRENKVIAVAIRNLTDPPRGCKL